MTPVGIEPTFQKETDLQSAVHPLNLEASTLLRRCNINVTQVLRVDKVLYQALLYSAYFDQLTYLVKSPGAFIRKLELLYYVDSLKKRVSSGAEVT